MRRDDLEPGPYSSTGAVIVDHPRCRISTVRDTFIEGQGVSKIYAAQRFI